MDEKQFHTHADSALMRIADGLADVEELGVDHMDDTVRIELPDRSRLVVNRHTAARQIWLAAPSGAWHFAPDESGERWIDARTGVEMYDQLERLIAGAVGRPVKLASPAPSCSRS
jgi:CyaY protein